LPEISSISAGFDILYRGEVALAPLDQDGFNFLGFFGGVALTPDLFYSGLSNLGI
jgi:hypothetical protein